MLIFQTDPETGTCKTVMMVFEMKFEIKTYVVHTIVKKLEVVFRNFATPLEEKTEKIPAKREENPSDDTVEKTDDEEPTASDEENPSDDTVEKTDDKEFSFGKSIDIIYVLVSKNHNCNYQDKSMKKLASRCTVWKGDLYYFKPEDLQSFCGFFGQLIPHVEEEPKSPRSKISS